MKKALNKFQKEIFDKIFLPRLIELAVNDKLPMDISALKFEDFKDECEKLSEKKSEKLEKALNDFSAGVYLSSGKDENSEGIYQDFMDNPEECSVWQSLENYPEDEIQDLIESTAENLKDIIEETFGNK